MSEKSNTVDPEQVLEYLMDALDLIEDLMYESDCWRSDDGGCPEHNYPTLNVNEDCPNDRAMKFLKYVRNIYGE